MQQLSPYQLHFLISLGMLVTAIPALLLTQKSLSLPINGIPLGALVGILFASGSLLFTLALNKMPAGITTAISLSYLLVVLSLSVIFLKEEITWAKAIGVLLTLIGVGILSFQSQH